MDVRFVDFQVCYKPGKSGNVLQDKEVYMFLTKSVENSVKNLVENGEMLIRMSSSSICTI